MDGEPGIAAGREAALAVLGRSKGEKDGWEDEEDMEEVIEEEGSRQRRNSLPNGRIVGSAEFRAGKRSQGQAEIDAEAAKKLKAFKARRLNERVLAQNTIAEAELAGTGTIKAIEKMKAFIRARTDEPVKEKGSDALLPPKPCGCSSREAIGYQAGDGARWLPGVACTAGAQCRCHG
eukprot:7391233-Prymnesium_polylepis.1